MEVPSLTSSVYSKTWPPMKIAPMTKVTMNQDLSFFTSPRSAANTPSWQVTEESTRIVVFVSAKGRFRASACSFQYSAPVTDRRVKYIAKRAAKNISSELSQMMVPTLVRFGRLTDGCACPVSAAAVAVATTDIMSVAYLGLTSGGTVRCVRRRCAASTASFSAVHTGVEGGLERVASALCPGALDRVSRTTDRVSRT